MCFIFNNKRINFSYFQCNQERFFFGWIHCSGFLIIFFSKASSLRPLNHKDTDKSWLFELPLNISHSYLFPFHNLDWHFLWFEAHSKKMPCSCLVLRLSVPLSVVRVTCLAVDTIRVWNLDARYILFRLQACAWPVLLIMITTSCSELKRKDALCIPNNYFYTNFLFLL